MTTIGGSEVAAVLGLDEYRSPYQLWLRKTGRDTSQVDNKYIQAGIILEAAVAEFFQTKTGYRIIKSSANQKNYIHPKYEFASGRPDRRYVGREVGQSVLECKTTQKAFDDPPENWFCQLQWYMGIVGMNSGAIAWLERGLDFKYQEYAYDKDFFDYMIGEVSNFYTNYIQKDVPPPPVNVEDLSLIYKRHTKGEVIQASEDVRAVYKQLKAVDQRLKEAESEKEELVNALKMVMRDAEAILSGARPIVTWKSSKASLTFDKDKFKADYPAMYEMYLVEKEGSRRFLIK